MKQQQKPWEAQKTGLSHRKVQEAYSLCHPILQGRESWSQGQEPQRNFTPWGKGEQENLRKTFAAFATQISHILHQCRSQLMELPKASPVHPFFGDGAVAVVVDGPAFRGPNSCCVPLSQIRTLQHLSIFGTRAAIVLHPSLGSQVLAVNPHCQGHTAIAMSPTPSQMGVLTHHGQEMLPLFLVQLYYEQLFANKL